jgi:hypothetical protein
MKIFIWYSIPRGLTNNYHSGGSCAVVAKDLDAARELLRKEENVDGKCEVFIRLPDLTMKLSGKQENMVLIFADAGCC